MKPHVENLVRLIEFRSIPHAETGSRQLLTLTKNGHRFLTDTQSAGSGQAFCHGFTKPREAHHDADLYQLYQKAVNIEGHGGQNLRVVLDYELKKHLYRGFAKVGKNRNSVNGKDLIAERHGLRVEGGFSCPTFESNTKLATENGLAWTLNLPPITTAVEISPKKSAFGFSLYAHTDVSRLRRILGSA
jgi:hypothetical protein